jgi:ribosomal protein S12
MTKFSATWPAQDVPGVTSKVVRGKYDLPHVAKKKT